MSRDHRFIFVKTRKTAGTSVEISLTRFCGDDDVVTPIEAVDEEVRRAEGLGGPRNHERLARPHELRRGHVRTVLGGRLPRHRLFWNHITAREIRARVPEEWEAFTTFSIVRNPWDYVLSRYRWEVYRRDDPSLTIDDVLRRWDPRQNWDALTIDGELAVDHVCRQEDLVAGLTGVLAGVGIAFDGWLPRAKGNTGRSADDALLLEPRHVEMIAARCAPEIEAFGYVYEPPQG